MNQICKVCGEPAAGYHFGAFTCEGCKSFFGRSYNNMGTINDCKNNNRCIIDKKNRTACKSCRLRKCVSVGMSKSGSRYGRRSNWFKIHCLIQDQNQKKMLEMTEEQKRHDAAAAATATAALMQQQMSLAASDSGGGGGGGAGSGGGGGGGSATDSLPIGMHLLGTSPYHPPFFAFPRREELLFLGIDDSLRQNTSPPASSSESHNSDSSNEVADLRRVPPPLLHSMPIPPYFTSPQGFIFPPYYQGLLPPHTLPGAASPTLNNNNNNNISNNNNNNNDNNKISKSILSKISERANSQIKEKREYLDAVLQLQRIHDRDSPEAPVEPNNKSVTTSTITPPSPLSTNASIRIPIPTRTNLSPVQENPIDLSMKSITNIRSQHHPLASSPSARSENSSSLTGSTSSSLSRSATEKISHPSEIDDDDDDNNDDVDENDVDADEDEDIVDDDDVDDDSDYDMENRLERMNLVSVNPLNLTTTKV